MIEYRNQLKDLDSTNLPKCEMPGLKGTSCGALTLSKGIGVHKMMTEMSDTIGMD